MLRKCIFLILLIPCIMLLGCKITGQVLVDGVPLSGVKVTVSGIGYSVAYTDSDGTYSIDTLGMQAGVYTVEPSMKGYGFDPASTSVTIKYFEEVNGINFAASIFKPRTMVLVNANSAYYTDYDDDIKFFIDDLTNPTIIDIRNTQISGDIGDSYDLIVIGHRQLDISGAYLTAIEQGFISAAVDSGTGFINFDNDLASVAGSRYQFIDDIFGFTYTSPVSPETGLDFKPGYHIKCWDHLNQQPEVMINVLIDDDNEWSEFAGDRPFPTVFAHTLEIVPTMNFHKSGIKHGTYNIYANLYTAYGGEDEFYYYQYGFTQEESPTTYDLSIQSNNSEQILEHTEYLLGSRSILNYNFDLFVNSAVHTDSEGCFFGWAWIRLEPVGTTMHYITSNYSPGQWINTGTVAAPINMTMAGIELPLNGSVETLITTSNGSHQPVLCVTTGYSTSVGVHAVQWGTYDWLGKDSVNADDLIIRSIKWAAQ